MIVLRPRLPFLRWIWVAVPFVVFTAPLATPAAAQILPGHGIASIRIGNSAKRVRRVLGPPRHVRPPAWGYGQPLAGQVAFSHRRRVFDIWTTSRRQRTRRGIGPGDRRRSMHRAYPHARCHRVDASAICQLATHRGHKTVRTEFFFKGDVLRQVEVYLVPPTRGSSVKK